MYSMRPSVSALLYYSILKRHGQLLACFNSCDAVVVCIITLMLSLCVMKCCVRFCHPSYSCFQHYDTLLFSYLVVDTSAAHFVSVLQKNNTH